MRSGAYPNERKLTLQNSRSIEFLQEINLSSEKLGSIHWSVMSAGAIETMAKMLLLGVRDAMQLRIEAAMAESYPWKLKIIKI